MDVADINKISNRKRIYTDAEKLREKVTRENAKIIKLKVAQDTAYWDLKEKLQQLQESHERLQQNMVDVQMQYETVSGQYQDELRLRPETLNKLNCTREICDVLEDYGERVRSSLERCRADQRELGTAYNACGARVKGLVADGAQARERERELRETIRMEHERRDADVRHLASLQEQLGAARARADELAQQLERCEQELRQREETASGIQTKVALLMRDFEKQVGELRTTIAAQEKQIQNAEANVEKERAAKITYEKRARDAEEHIRITEERARELDANVAQLHRDLGASLEQVRHMEEHREEANAAIIQLKNEIVSLNNNQRNKEKLISDKDQQVKELQEELCRMKLNISQVESEKDELVGQLHQITSQSQLQVSKVEGLTRVVTSLEDNLKETQAAYDAQRMADATKIEELSKAVSERDVELNTKAGTINKLMNDLKAAANAFDNARKQQDAERQQAIANVERLESSIRAKDSQLDDQMRLIRDLRTEKEHLRGEKERLLGRINDMQATIDNIQKLAGRGPAGPLAAPKAPAERDAGVVIRAPETEMYDFFSDDSDAINAGEVKRRYEALLRGDHKENVSLAQMKKDLNLKNRIFKNKRQENKHKKNKD